MTLTDVTAERSALESLLVLDTETIDRLPWRPVEGFDGVHEKVLWQFDSYVQALIRYEPGTSTAGAPHFAAHHHMWVVSGSALIAGRRVHAGSYLHVPPGVEHGVTEVSPDGCVILQMHRSHPPREADRLPPLS